MKQAEINREINRLKSDNRNKIDFLELKGLSFLYIAEVLTILSKDNYLKSINTESLKNPKLYPLEDENRLEIFKDIIVRELMRLGYIAEFKQSEGFSLSLNLSYL